MPDPTRSDDTVEGPTPEEAQTSRMAMGWDPPMPGSGWTRLPNGSWIPPEAAAPTPAMPSPEAEAPTLVIPSPVESRYVPPASSPPLPPGPVPKPVPSTAGGGSRRRTRIKIIAAALALFSFGLLLGIVLNHGFGNDTATISQLRPADGSTALPGNGSGSDGSGLVPYNPPGSNGSGSTQDGSDEAGNADVASIAEQVSGALVNINVSNSYSGAEGAATGIVLTSDGLVLTNNHVIDGQTDIKATNVGNGKTYTAAVLGYDKSRDIALIQLEGASGLQTAKIGDSSTVEVGQAVVAIGNAGGDGGTPDAVGGTVVALDQEVVAGDQTTGETERLSGLIQTDAAIRQGDSGGPLVNASGEVIGVTSVGSSSRSFDSVSGGGFAVPVNTAMEIVAQIQKQQSSDTVHIGATAFLGVQLSGSAGDGYGGPGGWSRPSSSGAMIAGVLSGSPADKIGLTAGDVIVSFDGRTVDSGKSLSTMIAAHQPGDRVQIVWQNQSGSQRSSMVDLIEGPAD